MKKLLIIILAFIPQIVWSAFGDVFTAKTTEGVEMTFKVISENNKTCQVGDGNKTAIDKSYSGAVTIPSQVNGYTITSIGYDAFYGCSDLTSISIPNTVTYFGGYAFSGCSSLTSITIPNGVTSIGNSSFSRCSRLTSIEIPNSVISIGQYAFAGCSGLTSITIPNGVTNIGDCAFAECNGLTSITIPNTVTSIGDLAFAECNGLTSITIPNGVTSIGNDTFCGCSGLTSIAIPNGVTSIGNSSFSRCSRLKSIEIPNSVTSIGDHAFSGCKSLESINIPNTVTSIADYTFSHCESLTSMIIPNTVTSIGAYAFAGCYSLPSITIPNSVTSIGINAFGGCISLTSMTIPSSVTTIRNQTFYNCKSMESIDIPNSVTSIGNHAFSLCRSLKSVNIPNSIKSIGLSAFSKCGDLTYINFPNSVTSVGDGVFEECPGLAAITWDANMPMTNEMMGTVSNPNLLFYTRDKSYVPSGIKNIIENGIAKEINLLEADSCNNFYCPTEFTAEKISYTHKYEMQSGIDGKAQGWETIALPFTVSEITHESKGKLLPFGAWTSSSDAKPFWLCKLSSSGFTRATTIEANTPYIICMPNNSDYDSSFNLSGNVTFTATNVKVPVSSSVSTAKSNGKTFIPAFCAQEKASGVYALNVNNSNHSEAGGYTEGSAFVSDLRAVSPFEAYMTTDANNAKRAFFIEFSETTGIDEMQSVDNKGGLHKVFNLNGQLVKKANSQRELDETLKQLPAGVYVVNGKKLRIK